MGCYESLLRESSCCHGHIRILLKNCNLILFILKKRLHRLKARGCRRKNGQRITFRENFSHSRIKDSQTFHWFYELQTSIELKPAASDWRIKAEIESNFILEVFLMTTMKQLHIVILFYFIYKSNISPSSFSLKFLHNFSNPSNFVCSCKFLDLFFFRVNQLFVFNFSFFDNC